MKKIRYGEQLSADDIKKSTFFVLFLFIVRLLFVSWQYWNGRSFELHLREVLTNKFNED